MEHRNIGPLSVSAVGLGCNNFGMRIDEAQTKLVVDAALEAGINFFDTADIYGGTKSEEFLGRALGARRKEVLVATKFGMEVDPERKGARPEYVARACADSLARLGTDYIDLYWLHRPDPETPIADTLGALDKLAREGKARAIGCSNFSPAQLREARTEARRLGCAGFLAVQNELSLARRNALVPESAEDGEAGVVDACAELGLAFVPFFPLASGLLSGKYRAGEPLPEGSRIASSHRAQERYLSEGNLALVERLLAWAESQGHSLLDLAIGWLLAQRTVASVIAGATKPEQVAANSAAGAWRLSEAELAEVAALL
jgi:aryl-alcohol dehydrogenase-like predicted oxidoreductase